MVGAILYAAVRITAPVGASRYHPGYRDPVGAEYNAAVPTDDDLAIAEALERVAAIRNDEDYPARARAREVRMLAAGIAKYLRDPAIARADSKPFSGDFFKTPGNFTGIVFSKPSNSTIKRYFDDVTKVVAKAEGCSPFAVKRRSGSVAEGGSALIIVRNVSDFDRWLAAWRTRRAKSTTDVVASTIHPDSLSAPDEAALVQLFRATAPVHFAGVDLGCQLFPNLNHLGTGKPVEYRDGSEGGSWRVQVIDVGRERSAEEDLQIIAEIGRLRAKGSPEQRRLADRVFSYGVNTCARLIKPPQLLEDEHRATLRLECDIVPYAVAACAELRIDIPVLTSLADTTCFNALGVRCAFTRRVGGLWHTVFHRRAGGVSLPDAWDIGAAGYVDPVKDRDPSDPMRLRPYMTAKRECSEELDCDINALPTDEFLRFFGVARNCAYGHLDIIGECIVPIPVQWRLGSEHVAAIEECRVRPWELAEFVGARGPWVPSAILTTLLLLHAWGYDPAEIEECFRPVLAGISPGATQTASQSGAAAPSRKPPYGG